MGSPPSHKASTDVSHIKSRHVPCHRRNAARVCSTPFPSARLHPLHWTARGKGTFLASGKARAITWPSDRPPSRNHSWPSIGDFAIPLCRGLLFTLRGGILK